MNDSLYVTTTIPYVNAPPHVGFALELVQADAIARYHRLLGKRVRFQTGTDENAFKNVLSARARGIPVEQLVDENSARFRTLCTQLDISIDRFLRTTEDGHERAVHAFLARLQPNDLYDAAYRGLYCAGCEDFYLERDLSAARCPEHGTEVIEIEEHNRFFRLSAYQDEIRQLIASRRLHVVPEAREAEVLQFVERGLNDISISRSAARSGGWGIPFPGDTDQIVYVWIDALINYLTGLGFPNSGFAGFWSEGTSKLHVIGKNVWKFHAVYWPALLLSAGLPVPDQVVAHGFLTIDGQKISKSTSNNPDPGAYVDELGADAVRYFLLRHVRPFYDSDFSVARLREAYNADLANALGNLCSRLTALCESVALPGLSLSCVPPAPPDYHDHFLSFRFDQALSALWLEVTRIDQEIAAAQPWVDVKAGRYDGVGARLRTWAERLAAAAYWLGPFLPTTAVSIRGILSEPFVRKAPSLFPRFVQRKG